MRLALLASAAALALAAAPSPAAAGPKAGKGPQVVKVSVTEDGFVPAVVKVKAGAPVQLVVTRTAEVTCATEIVLKDFGVNQPLPLGKAVTVNLAPKPAGSYRFACAMDMIAGTLEVE